MPESPHSAVARPERRQSQRRSCDFEIDIEWGAASLKGRVRELSGEGMFIELADPLWIGASFAATLALKNPVKVDCVVRRVIPRQGMAVSYGTGEGQGGAIAAILMELGGR
jgi:PilZ domain